MLFNSFQFLLFFIIVTGLYFILPYRFRWLLLLVASCVFYMAFIPVYIFILFGTIIIDYIAGILIENAPASKRKAYLAMSLVANIGVLAVFKYFNFFIDNANDVLHYLHITAQPLQHLGIILPIGLSFHTFQAMSYTIEVYRGHQKAERHFGIYSLYVMFYPQLVAGPIERPQNMLHQFHEEHSFSSENMLTGLRLMMWGLFKKVVVADRVSAYADAIFNHPGDYHNLQIIVGVLAFTIQIYCDFSGYSDMAIGSAKCMGFDLMTNFNRPYFSVNIREFWSRWHISLSTWFRDYLYISLGGNRLGKFKMYRNLAIVFLVSGFWHGANWTYVIWGGIHAFFNISYIMMDSYFKQMKTGMNRLMKPAGWLATFAVVSFAWIFFRAESFDRACMIVSRIFSHDHLFASFNSVKSFGTLSVVASLLACGYMMVIEKIAPPDLGWFKDKPYLDLAFCIVTIFMIVSLGVFKQQSFIYFQF